MYIKWMVPDYGMRGILNGIGRFLFGENDEVHYIGGAEVLPPPLDAGEESVCIRMLATDAAEEARRKLIEHNLQDLSEWNQAAGLQLTEQEARAQLMEFLPTLKRWKA